jgi:alpha-L-arabinofuranosidase
MTALERNGDIVTMASYAPLLAKKGHIQWKTDMIFFDNSKLCLTPNYHVQKMFSTNQGDLYYTGVVTTTDSATAASCVRDSKTGSIILKLVNVNERATVMKIDLSKFKGLHMTGKKTLLAGSADAENTLENSETIVPVESTEKFRAQFDYTAPPMSLTVIRVDATQR